MTDALRFAPETVRIQAGGTVTWTNPSDRVHTATDGANTFNSGNVSPGGSYSHTFDVAGTYRYICIPHESQGMTGTVVVE
ncbi:MAG: copper-binding protein [Gemmatimonadetes bacterium]|nr:copper-binding protein [Gemmatimonadota bacterium]